MRFEFIPVIILLSLLAIQYFIAKRRATVAVKTVTVEGEEGQKAPGNKLEIPQLAKDGWNKKTLEQKRWFLYVWIMIIAITVVYVVKHSFGGAYENMRFFIGGVVVLFVLHAVIWPFFTEKTSIITKAVTFAVFAFLSWSVITPDATVRVMKIYDDKIKDINENAFKGSPRPTSVAAPARYQPGPRKAYQSKTQKETRTIVFYATEDKFTEVKIPPGVQFSIDCPDDGLAKVFHRDAQQGIIHDCALPFEVGENLHDFRIGFSAKTKVPIKGAIRITS